MFLRTTFWKICIRGATYYGPVYQQLEAVTQHGSVESHGDVEAAIYHQQYLDQVHALFRQRVRFVGDERQACLYILKCLLKKEQPSSGLLEGYYKISKTDVRFFKDYVRVLYRALCYRFREKEMENGIFVRSMDERLSDA